MTSPESSGSDAENAPKELRESGPLKLATGPAEERVMIRMYERAGLASAYVDSPEGTSAIVPLGDDPASERIQRGLIDQMSAPKQHEEDHR